MNVSIFAGRSRFQYLRRQLTVQRTQLRQSTKRHNSSKPPTEPAQPPPKDAPAQPNRSIPGAGWAWIEPLTVPFRAYGRMQHRSPLLTQLSSTLTIYFLGDLSAQKVSNPDAPYEPIRGLRALIIGGIISIPNYKWFMFLGNHFNYSSHIASLAVKICVNQTVFTPLFNSYFFGMQTVLSGGGWEDVQKRVRETVPVSWVNSWKVWPAVTAFSFTFVPPQYRSVFAGIIAIGWQTYLSWLNMRAAEEDKARLGGTAKA